MRPLLKQILILTVVVLLMPLYGEEFRLTGVDVAPSPILVGTNAGALIQKQAKSLADMIGRITGTTPTIGIGDGSHGICLGVPSDFSKLPFAISFPTGPFEREHYLLRSSGKGLWLLGATELAVQDAVWDLLYRFGHRQFFPGATWEVVPELPTLAIDIDRLETPDFRARRIWYNWGLWGYNNQPYAEWCIRNRMAKGFDLNSGHSYERIIAANREAFTAHPEYAALVGGERKLLKFCVGNPDLRRLVVQYAVDAVKQNPQLDSLSLDPSDGDGWCECPACAAIGSPSDCAVTLANAAAVAINELGLGEKYIGMYAYNAHAPPPSIAVNPKVIISVATAFIRGTRSFDEIVEGWQKQGATTGVYDYYSVIAWDWNRPKAAAASDPYLLAQRIARQHRQGARFLDAESGDAWGAYGLGYYVASRIMWDVDNADKVADIVGDFLARAFGPAMMPMIGYYHLITTDQTQRSSADLLGRMYRQLAAAREAAAGNAAVLARIADLVLYTRYVELYEAYAATNSPETKNAVLAFAHRSRSHMMIHSYGIWARMASQQAAHSKDHPAITDEAPFTESEIQLIVQNGIAANQPVELDFETRKFSSDLMPAFAALQLPDLPAGTYPDVPQDYQNYDIWVEKAPAEIKLKVTVQHRWNNRPHEISLFSPNAVDIKAVDSSDICRPDGKAREVILSTPYTGLHRIQVRDGGDNTFITWPDNLPVTLPSALDTAGVKNHFRGSWTLYFYVPRGCTQVAGWAERIANWSPRISGELVDPDGNTVLDFANLNDGWFKAPVKAGQDGKLWLFRNSQGVRQLVTAPPYLARRPQDLLLPREVIEADSRWPPLR